MNIGIFSGSFNPIHIGHLILANYIVEFTDIDEVWFLVSPHNPLKSEEELSSEHIRMEMTELALTKYPKIIACDFEFSMPKPSYTINTLNALRKQYPEYCFTLIIGADNWNVFESWREYDKILENYKLKVYPRLGSRITIPNKFRDKVEALESPIIEISSTFIRDSISEGKDVRAFLPDEVYDYIIEKDLYKQR
ncbi:nicotinate-nucleotide adenylyltransferase [Dysgonomonas sp. Marseille-P4677]|uniref:nicotinate (nicotinamide) nucleotide adenylyltransferase n=1 Tax=Dysgonomonas sp. Marseille-P4677 TaxID=2364790 RepID=UPI00191187B6|nr:nicotinate (nicotinamide) nucleotide adenylyltransferase [Dysgonomonas sp. Marseille-P4677]MBK5721117.1 nicotinate-nucleotide adenylyltransferase [Dysgonomonas sp. Marseille-P4677]